jgi:hypothetical protein
VEIKWGYSMLNLIKNQKIMLRLFRWRKLRMINQLKKKVEKSNIYKEYAQTINGLYNLTDRQLDVLACLLEINETCPKVYGLYNILTKDYRDQIIRYTGIGYCNLSTILTVLKSKGLIENSQGWKIVNEVRPVIKDNKLSINIEISW